MRERRSRATYATRGGRWKDLPFSSSSCNFGKKARIPKARATAGLLGGLRRRAVSGAHAVELELKLKNQFAIKTKKRV